MLTFSLRKEIRQIAPVWAGALLLALSLALGMSGTVMGPFGIGVPWSTFLVPLQLVICSLLATAAFGREMAMGTLGSMLAAPEPRSRWWKEKVAATGVALVTVAAAFTLMGLLNPGVRSDIGLSVSLTSSWIIPWCALGPGMYLTLLLRHPVGAFWLTMLIPGAIATVLISLSPWLGIETAETALWLIVPVLVVYGAAGLVLSKRQIDRWQDTGFGAQELTLAFPRLRRRSGDAAVQRVLRRTPLRSLLVKELSLQQMNLAIALVLFLGFLSGLWLRGYSNGDWADVPVMVFRLMWFVLPFTIGAVAVAEERRLGTLEWQHTLPISRKRQWRIKATVCYTLGLLLGVGVALLMDDWAGQLRWIAGSEEKGWAWFLVLVIESLAGTTLGLYASSLSRQFFQSLSFILALLMLLVGLALAGRWIVGIHPPVSPLPLLALVGGVIGIGTVWVLGRGNYRELQIGSTHLFANAKVWGLAVLLWLGVSAAVYHRTWEWVTLPMPPKGPDVTQAGITSKVTSYGVSTFALLPNGKVWWLVPQTNLKQPEDFELLFLQAEEWRTSRIGQAGEWRSIVMGPKYRFALQKDGSLWAIWNRDHDRSPLDSEGRFQLSRVAESHQWRSIAGNWKSLLAIDEDGRLWEWETDRGERRQFSGDATEEVNLTLVDSSARWRSVNCLRHHHIRLGVQEDGTLWAWGKDKSGMVWKDSEEFPIPTRVNDQTDWAYVTDNGRPLVRKQDGSYWSTPGLVHWELPGREIAVQRDWIRLGTRNDWSQVQVPMWREPFLFMIREDGSLWKAEQVAYDPETNTLLLDQRRIGHRDDWVALGQGMGLTADGKFWNWHAGTHGVEMSKFIPYRFRPKAVADLAP